MNPTDKLLAVLVTLTLTSIFAFGTVPNQVNFQGTLADSSGSPITGFRDLGFFLYADSVGGSSLWNESHSSIEVDDGLFRVLLGSISPFSDSLFNGQVLWLEIGVETETMAPRSKIVSVPYSVRSTKTDHAVVADSAWYAIYADTAGWAISGMVITHVDTADFAFYADSAGISASASEATHATTADTANWALDFAEITHVDTADYSVQSGHALDSDSALHATTSDTADWALGHPEVTHVDTADFAFQADQADDASHADYSDSAGYASAAPPDDDWTTSAGNIHRLSGNVGIGTEEPDRRLHIAGASESNDACLHLDAWWNPEIFMDKGGYDADSKIHFLSDGIPWWTFYHDGSEDALKFLHDGVAMVMTLSSDNKVGIGTMTPAEKLDVVGTIQMTGFKMTTDAGLGEVLTSDAAGVGTWQTPPAKIGGTGSTNYLAKFSDSTTIANSIVFENASQIGIGTTTPAQKLDVAGTVKMTGFQMPTGAIDGYVLTSNASGAGSWHIAIGGSGSGGVIPKFTETSGYALENSVIFQHGTYIGIGQAVPSHRLEIVNTGSDDVLRLVGPGGTWGYGARLNFGDNDYVYLDEDLDDNLTIYAAMRTAIMGGNVGINTLTPTHTLHVEGSIYGSTVNTGLGDFELYAMDQHVRTIDGVTFATLNTGQGNYELYAMNQNVRNTDAVTFNTVTTNTVSTNTVNTGWGNNELYPMNQSVLNTDAVTFSTVNTGNGANELYAMNQNVRTTDGVTFLTVNTGQGNYELYGMDQNVRTTDAVAFNTVFANTVNTGAGANELFAMNQNVQTTDSPTFFRLYLNNNGYALGGFHVGGSLDPGDDNLIVDGNTSLGTTVVTTTHRLVVQNSAADDVLRLIGPDGSYGYGARLNFGDGDYVYLDEDEDDKLTIYANRTAIMSSVGIGTTSPSYNLDVAGSCHASSFPTSSDERLKTNVQQLSNVLDKVEKIRGVAFDWNSTYEAMGRSTGHREIGVIAQEVEAQFPELVTTWGDQNYRAVDYGRLTAVLIEAVKELKTQNEELQKKNNALEQRVTTLERTGN